MVPLYFKIKHVQGTFTLTFIPNKPWSQARNNYVEIFKLAYFARIMHFLHFSVFLLCFITSTGVLLTFVCNDRMSETVDEMDSTASGILDEAISFINRTVKVSHNNHVTCRSEVLWLNL